MARLNMIDPTTAEGPSKALLDGVKKKLGIVPNMTRAMANSPAVLEGYLGLSGAVGAGALPATLREKIALRTAQVNGCEYCLAAHTAIGGMLKLDDDEIVLARKGAAPDAKEAAALAFADAVLSAKGGVSDADLDAVRAAGYGDGEIGEIVANVVVNLFTNYFNRVAHTDVDFPIVGLDIPESATA